MPACDLAPGRETLGALTVKSGRTGGFLVFLFVLGLLLLNAPLLSIFDKADYVLGIPVLYLYLFVMWAVLILLMALAIADASITQDPSGEAGAEDGSD